MSACVETHYARSADGYGRCAVRRFGRVIYRAHVLAWVDANGRLPDEGMCICHTCDNPACVNPEHLWEGTVLQNIADRVAKGRSNRTNVGINWSKEVCPKCGGEYSQEKVGSGRVGRRCVPCRNERVRARYHAKRATV